MGRVSKVDTEAQNAIKAMMAGKSLRSFAKDIDVNRGYLSAVLHGTRPASRTLRTKLGLQSKYAPHRVMRITQLVKRIRALKFDARILDEIESALTM